MDKVSIIIPTYNCAEYLEYALESALAQTWPEVEVIVIDDGSTDKTWEIFSKREGNFKIIRKPNGGTASALNAGIKASTGDWIHWLSADDVLGVFAVEQMMKEIEQTPKNHDCIFFSHYNYIDGDGNITGAFIEPNYNEWNRWNLEKELWKKFIGNGSSSMIHRHVFARCGLYDESIFPCEDYEFWLRAVILNGVGFHLVNSVTLFYRIHGNQLTQTMSARGAESVKNIRRQIYEKMTDEQKRIFAKPD